MYINNSISSFNDSLLLQLELLKRGNFAADRLNFSLKFLIDSRIITFYHHENERWSCK